MISYTTCRQLMIGLAFSGSLSLHSQVQSPVSFAASRQKSSIHHTSTALLPKRAETFYLSSGSGKGNFHLRYTTQRNTSIHIFNASGQLMFFRLLDPGANGLSLKTGLPEGLYIYTICGPRGQVLKTAKLVVSV